MTVELWLKSLPLGREIQSMIEFQKHKGHFYRKHLGGGQSSKSQIKSDTLVILFLLMILSKPYNITYEN
jgi:hypothetical protein